MLFFALDDNLTRVEYLSNNNNKSISKLKRKVKRAEKLLCEPEESVFLLGNDDIAFFDKMFFKNPTASKNHPFSPLKSRKNKTSKTASKSHQKTSKIQVSKTLSKSIRKKAKKIFKQVSSNSPSANREKISKFRMDPKNTIKLKSINPNNFDYHPSSSSSSSEDYEETDDSIYYTPSGKRKIKSQLLREMANKERRSKIQEREEVRDLLKSQDIPFSFEERDMASPFRGNATVSALREEDGERATYTGERIDHLTLLSPKYQELRD